MLPALFLLIAAADPALPHLQAVRTAQPPVIDGRLDDPAWQTAAPSEHFVQQWPSEGQPPSEKTTLRVLYDDEALYVAFDCHQLKTPIIQRLTRRDQDSESDWIQLQLDTRRDGKTAFAFAVNVSGVMFDGTIRNQSIMSGAWDENWEARTALTDHGWSVELRIPLRILRFDSTLPVQSWGMQATRIIEARGEAVQWTLVPRSVSDWVSRFGTLDDLRGLKQGGRLELRPFVTARAEHQQPSAGVAGRDFALVKPSWREAPAGLDLKWHVAQDLTLDGALLPEFGQVEADQLILNLTNYETFLPEKRPLFLEGIETFSTPEEDAFQSGQTADYFPNRLFYSRRIGTAPPLPALGDGEHLTAHPQPSVIFGAAKLTGQLGAGTTVGALSVLTGENRLSTDLRPSLVAAPATAFNVFRVRRELGAGHLGLIATGTSRLEGDAGVGACASGLSPGADGRCFHDAYVGGVDGQLRFGRGLYTLGAQLTGTRIVGGPQRTMPDGTAIGPGASGLGLWARLAKEGGASFVGDAEYTGQSRRLDYNDAGYMARQNLHQAKAAAEYRTLNPNARLIETHLRLEASARWTLDGMTLGRHVQLGERILWRNFWSGTVTAGVDLARFDDREIGDQVTLDAGTTAALERAGALWWHVDLASDPRRAVLGWVGGEGRIVDGGRTYTGWIGATAHPVPQLELLLEPSFSVTRGEPRFAATLGASAADRQYVFGPLVAKSASATLRASYTFTPRLTLQAYAQLFLASGHFDDLRTVPIDGGRFRLAAIAAAPGSTLGANDADFEQAAVNANLVLRWEYRLGAIFYLVYARSQIPTVDNLGGAPADLHLSSLRHGAASDVVLLKLSYWWAS